jgi:uncharacterized DUF497 family protein
LTNSFSVARIEFDFDPGKDATNLSKHGFSLAAAAQLCWEAALVWIDDRAEVVWLFWTAPIVNL